MTSPSTSSHICGSRVVLLSIGDFNPPTYVHMRMFECARDFVHRTLHCEVLEGVMMTSSNRYPIDNLHRKHRLRMVETAIRRSNWIRSSDWAASQHDPVKYSTALRHVLKEIKAKYGNAVHLIYMCGSNVISNLQKNETERARWTQTEVADILKENGLIVFRRGGHKPQHTIYQVDALRNNQANIFVIEDETFPNNTSSERIRYTVVANYEVKNLFRTAIRRGESVKYCVDDAVLEYIQEQKIFGQELQDFFPDNERSSSTTSTFSSTVSSFLENKRPKSSETDVIEDYHPPPVSPRSSSIGKIGNGSSMTSSSREPSEQPSVRLNTVNTVCPRHGTKKKREPSRVEKEDHHEKCALYAKIDKSRKRTEPEITVSGVLAALSNQPHTMEVPETSGTPQGSPIPPAKNSPEKPRNPSKGRLPPNEAVPKTPLVIAVKSHELNGVPMRTVGSTEGLTPLLTERVPSDSPLPSMAHTRPPKQLSPLPLRINNNIHYNPPFSPTLESPNYDNVTLDELLASSNHWAEYMEKQALKLKDKTEPPRDLVDTRSKLNEEIKEKEGKPSKKKTGSGWFFRRKSSKEKEEKAVLSPTSEEEKSVIRICGTDRREQPQTSPEILWRKINSEKKIKLNGLPPSPKKAICLRHPTATVIQETKSPEKKKNDAPKNLRFIKQLTQSAENLPSYVQDVQSPMSQSCYEGSARDVVTLTFRRYRLTATPETTV